jgi:hypothetical protein
MFIWGSQLSSVTRYGVSVVLLGICTIFYLTVIKLITNEGYWDLE